MPDEGELLVRRILKRRLYKCVYSGSHERKEHCTTCGVDPANAFMKLNFDDWIIMPDSILRTRNRMTTLIPQVPSRVPFEEGETPIFDELYLERLIEFDSISLP